MDWNPLFEALIAEMKSDGRYRTFIELERIAGAFPQALRHDPDGKSRPVTSGAATITSAWDSTPTC